MNTVIAELNMNWTALHGYVNSLRNLVIGLYDADVWEMAEWDWQWPEHPPLIMRQEQLRKSPEVPQSLRSSLQQLYRDYERPPSLLDWALEWDGSETLFLRFIDRKLQIYREHAKLRFEDERQKVIRNVRDQP